MNFLSPMLLCDFYKISHREMYPEKTEEVYSTWIPRASRLHGVTRTVNFGTQMFIKNYLIDFFNKEFFSQPIEKITEHYKFVISTTLGVKDPCTKHIEDLHKLGFLPLSIRALPEGVLVPLRVPVMSICNTDKRFFWLTNYIESLGSCELWQPATSATIAHEYRKLLNQYAMETVGNTDFVQFQGHDFSMRGMSSLASAISSGMGHLTSFCGTDTIPSIEGVVRYYNGKLDKELIGTSIPATEHSVQCAYGDDMEYYKNIISKVHPNGFVSIVSDGYDFWDVMGRVIPALKDLILARDGKVVVRPDSGDPVTIICGDPSGETELQRKGAIEVLWDIFGGTMSEKGYKLLDSHIGCIYGDAITLDRAKQISKRLKDKGFASINVVYGIGSYTYQFNTRDTLGWTLKASACIIDGKDIKIFKDPKTDTDHIKKSLIGRAAVVLKDGDYHVVNGISYGEAVSGDQLVEVFRDGNLLVDQSFSEIRARIASSNK